MPRLAVRACVVMLVSCIVSLPANAATTDPVSKVVIWTTAYTGAYEFLDYRKSIDYAGKATVTTQNQSYEWTEEVKDVIVPQKNGTITETRYITVDSHGDYEVITTGTGGSRKRCEYTSKPGHEFKSKVLGNPEGVAPIRGNPLIPYTWTIPEYAGLLGVRSSCASGPGGEILAYTPSSADTVGLSLKESHKQNRDFGDAFDGSASARFDSMPASYPINATLEGRADLQHGGFESARVKVAGSVVFSRFGDPRNNNKVGSLLLEDLLKALGVEASGDDSAIADGDDDTIWVPAVAPGTVDLEVSANVAPGRSSHAHSAAVQPTTIYTGKATVNGSAPAPMRLMPTAAGRAALSATHPTMPIEMTATFNPTGSGQTITEKLSGTLGARTS